MMSDVTFGKYYPSSSYVHKMDARTKLVLLIIYIVMIFVVKNFYGFLCVVAFLSLAITMARIPVIKILKSMKAVLFVILLTVILNLFFYRGKTQTIIWSFKFIKVTKEALSFSAFMAVRLVLLVIGSSLLNLTTTPVALTDGIESLLKPLEIIKFPLHELALVMSIALRFIPILASEADRIMNAQKARGADFESGNIISRAKAMIPVLVPLLVSALRRADELGDAMDARCYSGSAVRTKFKKAKFTYRDVLGVVFIIAALSGVIALNVLFGVMV